MREVLIGLKTLGHDTGAALIFDEKVVAISEERLSRVKYSPNAFPDKSIKYCLEKFGLTNVDVTHVIGESIDNPDNISTEQEHAAKIRSLFPNAAVSFINHHDAHAASAFFCSPFRESAVLVYDGNGSFFSKNESVTTETETMYHGYENRLKEVHKTVHSIVGGQFVSTSGIGHLYSTFSEKYIGFGSYNEGKMMGLAAYGDDRLLKQFPLSRWVKLLAQDVLCNARIIFPARNPLTHLRKGVLHTLRVLYRGVRRRFMEMVNFSTSKNQNDERGDTHFEPVQFERRSRDIDREKLPSEYWGAVACMAQRTFEEAAVLLGNILRSKVASENLCIAGGCALNIDANRNFLTKVGFKDLFAQPAASDCGIPLGAALWGWHMILQRPRFWVMQDAALGRVYDLSEIDQAIERHSSEIKCIVSENIAVDAAGLIADGKIVGWFQGGSEYGPRALGHRSILCDARDPNMKDVLNKRVKHREMWRPFACSILEEDLHSYFDLEPNSATGYMLLCGTVHESQRSKVPSIVHVDNTCRMQTVSKENNGVYYELINEYKKITGVSLVINTSFNLAGDPIVESPEDALDTFLRTDMDHLILGDRVITKVLRG